VSDGVSHELADGVHFQFAHDIGSMRFCCFDADAQSDGDFLLLLSSAKS